MNNKVSSTPPPDDAMIEAGIAAMDEHGRFLNTATVTAIYLAMNAARSNQEATPDAVEAVARAIYEKQFPSGTSWDDWGDYVRDNHDHGFDGRDPSRDLARTAIEAMPVQEATRTVGDARLREAAKRTIRELRDHAENLSPRHHNYPADMMLREAKRLDAALTTKGDGR